MLITGGFAIVATGFTVLIAASLNFLSGRSVVSHQDPSRAVATSPDSADKPVQVVAEGGSEDSLAGKAQRSGKDPKTEGGTSASDQTDKDRGSFARDSVEAKEEDEPPSEPEDVDKDDDTDDTGDTETKATGANDTPKSDTKPSVNTKKDTKPDTKPEPESEPDTKPSKDTKDTEEKDKDTKDKG